MARPKSDDRRSAIMAAATRVIAAQGLGAATAAIAKEAGVSNGSLFTYFTTKAELMNQLYAELKAEQATVALDGLPEGDDIRAQVFHMWSQWLRWAIASPERRRTLALLRVSDDITVESQQMASRTMAEIAGLLERSRENGPMRDVPLGFVVALMTAVTDATIDFMIRDPENADRHGTAAFDGLWRMIA
jgi:AcrR family transcriptional regulator